MVPTVLRLQPGISALPNGGEPPTCVVLVFQSAVVLSSQRRSGMYCVLTPLEKITGKNYRREDTTSVARRLPRFAYRSQRTAEKQFAQGSDRLPRSSATVPFTTRFESSPSVSRG